MRHIKVGVSLVLILLLSSCGSGRRENGSEYRHRKDELDSYARRERKLSVALLQFRESKEFNERNKQDLLKLIDLEIKAVAHLLAGEKLLLRQVAEQKEDAQAFAAPRVNKLFQLAVNTAERDARDVEDREQEYLRAIRSSLRRTYVQIHDLDQLPESGGATTDGALAKQLENISLHLSKLSKDSKKKKTIKVDQKDAVEKLEMIAQELREIKEKPAIVCPPCPACPELKPQKDPEQDRKVRALEEKTKELSAKVEQQERQLAAKTVQESKKSPTPTRPTVEPKSIVRPTRTTQPQPIAKPVQAAAPSRVTATAPASRSVTTPTRLRRPSSATTTAKTEFKPKEDASAKSSTIDRLKDKKSASDTPVSKDDSSATPTIKLQAFKDSGERISLLKEQISNIFNKVTQPVRVVMRTAYRFITSFYLMVMHKAYTLYNLVSHKAYSLYSFAAHKAYDLYDLTSRKANALYNNIKGVL